MVDNASRDGSCDRIAADFPEVTLIRLEQNTGFAAANNLAVRRAESCEWIALLNPDAFPEPNWLEALMDAAARRPEYSFFGSRMAVYQELGDRYSAIEPPSLAGLFATDLRKRGLSVATVDGAISRSTSSAGACSANSSAGWASWMETVNREP